MHIYSTQVSPPTCGPYLPTPLLHIPLASSTLSPYRWEQHLTFHQEPCDTVMHTFCFRFAILPKYLPTLLCFQMIPLPT